jgi:hypothetical protein
MCTGNDIVMAFQKILMQYSPGGSEENLENLIKNLTQDILNMK